MRTITRVRVHTWTPTYYCWRAFVSNLMLSSSLTLYLSRTIITKEKRLETTRGYYTRENGDSKYTSIERLYTEIKKKKTFYENYSLSRARTIINCSNILRIFGAFMHPVIDFFLGFLTAQYCVHEMPRYYADYTISKGNIITF